MKDLFIAFLLITFLFACGREGTNSISSNSENPKSSSKKDDNTENFIRQKPTTADSDDSSDKENQADIESERSEEEENEQNDEEEIEIEEESAPYSDPVKDDYDFHAYESLNNFLKSYVSSSGKVNYASIKKHKSELNDIIKEFEKQNPKSSWTNNQKLAFWINVYNIYTIKLVTDGYPTTSITKLNGGKPWDKKFIKISGKTYSLDNVENAVIRKQFSEPRIHFALNCASESCPILLNVAYTSGNLDSKLTSQTKKFLNDTSKNKFEKKSAKISKIFDWYKKDFTKGGSSVLKFINSYQSNQLDLKKTKVEYLEYSWDLND